MSTKEESKKSLTTTIVFNAEERELILKLKKMTENRVRRTMGVDVKIPMREAVISAIKSHIAAESKS